MTDSADKKNTTMRDDFEEFLSNVVQCTNPDQIEYTEKVFYAGMTCMFNKLMVIAHRNYDQSYDHDSSREKQIAAVDRLKDEIDEYFYSCEKEYEAKYSGVYPDFENH